MKIVYWPRRLQGTMAALSVCLVINAPAPALAEVYKCISADGSTAYNDKPCAVDESTYLLSRSARQIKGLDCRIARNFALDTAKRMRQNDSANDVFKAYGGAQSLSEDARRLINQVFTFEDNNRVTVQQIVGLTMDRCEAGLLGKSLDRCETFPEQFVVRDANCDAENQVTQNARAALRDTRTAPVPVTAEPPATYAPAVNPAALAVRVPSVAHPTQTPDETPPGAATDKPASERVNRAVQETAGAPSIKEPPSAENVMFR